MKIRNALKNKIVRNASWIVGVRILRMIISFAVSILTTRFLGPSGFGSINYGMAYTAFFLSVCTLGLNNILVKEFVDCRFDEGTVLGTSLCLRTISSFLSAGVIFCIVSVVDAGDPTVIQITMLCSISLIFQVFEVFNYWFQARLESKVTSLISLAAFVVMSAYKVWLYVQGKGVVWFAFSTTIDYIVMGVLLLIAYICAHGSRLRVSWICARAMLKDSCHFILPNVMVAVYAYVDKIMLRQMIDDAEVGCYSTAVSFCTVWCFVLAAIIDSMVPSIMEAHKQDPVLFRRRNCQLYALVFYISVGASTLITVLAEPLVLLLYGEAYRGAILPLRIITWYTAFSYLGTARGTWMICEGKQRYLKYIYMSAALANVLLNWLFIPIWGASGAALASLISQVLTIFFPLCLRPVRENAYMMIDAILLRGIRAPRKKK